MVIRLFCPLRKMEINCVRNELKISIRFCISSCNNEEKLLKVCLFNKYVTPLFSFCYVSQLPQIGPR